MLSFDGARRGSALGVRLLGFYGYGMNTVPLRKSPTVGRVLRNASAMIAEREALRMGIETFDSFISD